MAAACAASSSHCCLHAADAPAKFTAAVIGHTGRGDYGQNLKTLTTLKPFIDDFFDKVMVMCEDRELRLNRAALLQQLGQLMNQVADISKLAV